jgi:hypothetical protein
MVDADVAKTHEPLRPSAPCELCDARPLTAFSWSYAESSDDSQLAKLRRRLRETDSLKSGWLYRCPTCEQAWYLDVAKSVATRVPREREELLRAWSSRRYEIAIDHHDVLRSIGGVEGDRRGNDRGYLRIPCGIEWTDGTTSDPCLIVVTSHPPISETMRRVRLFDAVGHVEPSGFALPRTVRCATRKAEERRMGFAPTAIETPSGRVVLLDWLADVFEHEGVVGSQVRLARRWPDAGDQTPVVSEPRDRITYVFADPSEATPDLGFRCS